MKEVYSEQIKRRIFTRNRWWNDPHRVDALVFKIALLGAALALCFSWGGQS
jgi:hypothetical protein